MMMMRMLRKKKITTPTTGKIDGQIFSHQNGNGLPIEVELEHTISLQGRNCKLSSMRTHKNNSRHI
jgi:hypothetical protein